MRSSLQKLHAIIIVSFQIINSPLVDLLLKIAIQATLRDNQLDGRVVVGRIKKDNSISRRTVLSSHWKCQAPIQAKEIFLIVLEPPESVTKESNWSNRQLSAVSISNNFIDSVEMNMEMSTTNLPQDSFVIPQ